MAERLDYINERMLHTFQCFTPVLTLHDSKGPHAGRCSPVTFLFTQTKSCNIIQIQIIILWSRRTKSFSGFPLFISNESDDFSSHEVSMILVMSK